MVVVGGALTIRNGPGRVEFPVLYCTVHAIVILCTTVRVTSDRSTM